MVYTKKKETAKSLMTISDPLRSKKKKKKKEKKKKKKVLWQRCVWEQNCH